MQFGIETSTHDHAEDGDGLFGKHGHAVRDIEVVKAIARVGKSMEEYRENYFKLYRALRDALGLCGKCESCWTRFDDGEVPSEDELIEVVKGLAFEHTVEGCLMKGMD